MKRNKIFMSVVSIIHDHNDEVLVNNNRTKFSDIGMDSLSVVEVVMSCEERFDIHCDEDEMLPITVGDLVDIIYGKVKDRPPTQEEVNKPKKARTPICSNKPIRLKVNAYTDRSDIIRGLINSGYTVRVEEAPWESSGHEKDYYVVII